MKLLLSLKIIFISISFLILSYSFDLKATPCVSLQKTYDSMTLSSTIQRNCSLNAAVDIPQKMWIYLDVRPFTTPVSQAHLYHTEQCAVTDTNIKGLDPFTGFERQILVRWFEPLKKRPGQMLIIPPKVYSYPNSPDYYYPTQASGPSAYKIATAAMSPMDASLAIQLCRAGLRTWVLRDWQGREEAAVDLAVVDRSSVRAIVAIQQAMNAMVQVGPQQGSNFGIFGTSLGGGLASMATGVESRIKALGLFCFGGPLPDVITTSQNTSIQEGKKIQMQQLGLTFGQYADEMKFFKLLQQNLKIDILQLTRPEMAASVYIGHCPRDSNVWPLFQLQLSRAWGVDDSMLIKPQLLRGQDHKPSIGILGLENSYGLVDFFLQRLGSMNHQ